MRIKKADWVKCNADDSKNPRIGFVKRLAKDGSWADVDWHSHRKRMRTEALEPMHTIPLAGCTVTDMTREAELR